MDNFTARGEQQDYFANFVRYGMTIKEEEEFERRSEELRIEADGNLPVEAASGGTPISQHGPPYMTTQMGDADALMEMMGGASGMNLFLQQMMQMQQMQMLPDSQSHMSISDTASASSSQESQEGKSGSYSHSSGSHTPSHSVSPPHEEIDENVQGIIDAIHNDVNGRSSPSQLAMTSSNHSNRESYYECFSSTSEEEVRALVYSLFVVSKGTTKDGYENFECFTRTKNKCRFKVRVKCVDGVFSVEERGCHSHPYEGKEFSSQGLPKQIREIVDKSFAEGWTHEIRQRAVDECVSLHGFPPNPRMTRQIDNRLSYLRRTKNISSSHSMVPSSLPIGGSSFPSLSTSALASLLDTPSDAFSSLDVNQLAQMMVAQQAQQELVNSTLGPFPGINPNPN